MVVIECVRLLPWMTKCDPFRVLFKMSKVCDKPLFVSGRGTEFIANFCAIGEREIHVVNGHELGSDLTDFDLSLVKNPNTDVFLDNRTGDFYQVKGSCLEV